jgi:hypothetical protein
MRGNVLRVPFCILIVDGWLSQRSTINTLKSETLAPALQVQVSKIINSREAIR